MLRGVPFMGVQVLRWKKLILLHEKGPENRKNEVNTAPPLCRHPEALYDNNLLWVILCNGRDRITYILCSFPCNHFPHKLSNPINYTQDAGFPSVISWCVMDYRKVVQWTKKNASPRIFFYVCNEGRGMQGQGCLSASFREQLNFPPSWRSGLLNPRRGGVANGIF